MQSHLLLWLADSFQVWAFAKITTALLLDPWFVQLIENTAKCLSPFRSCPAQNVPRPGGVRLYGRLTGCLAVLALHGRSPLLFQLV